MYIYFKLLWRFQCIQLKILPDTQQDTVGMCDNFVYYLVMHTHMKPDSTVDTLWVLHETTSWSLKCIGANALKCSDPDVTITYMTPMLKSHTCMYNDIVYVHVHAHVLLQCRVFTWVIVSVALSGPAYSTCVVVIIWFAV